MVSILDNIYKAFQLTDVFISKYGYNQVILDTFSSYASSEVWLFNNDNKDYELIRITTASTLAYLFDEERINIYINYFKGVYKKEIKFLDIHICDVEYNPEYEPYPYINIEENFLQGVDIDNCFPLIKNVIHNVEDPKSEMVTLVDTMKKAISERKKNLPLYKRIDMIATYSIMIICTIVYLLTMYLNSKYSEGVAYILLGADYMTFTKGLNQFYRLITCGLVHGGFIHLISNMYSLFVLGRFVERNYGSLKFILILIICTFVGSISQSILSSNGITVGISAGLYGLMVFFILDLIIYRKVPVTSFLPLIFINISINFMSTTAFIAHMGGLIAGYILYLIFNQKNNKGLIVLLVILLLSLSIKYVTIKTINPFFQGTDMEVVKAYSDFGFKGYSQKLFERLLTVYKKYGG